MDDKKQRLDQFVTDIEFLLISVVQGVALGTLASNATSPVTNFHFEYWLYIASGFLFILNFWSQAIIHTLSFIDWPIDLTHNFLYFLIGLVEVMAFSQITDPPRWFEFISFFFIVAAMLYIVDLSIIKKHKEKYNDSPQHKILYKHILDRQVFELKLLLPLGLIYNIGATGLIYLNPEFFLKNHYHIVLVTIQVMFGFLVLKDSVRIFKRRSHLITLSATQNKN